MKVLVLVCAFTTTSWALNEYYGVSRSLRALGMGGSFYAVSDDEYALHYNPAGLVFVQDTQMLFSANSTVSTDGISGLSTLLDLFSGSKNQNDTAGALSKLQGRPIHLQAGGNIHYVRKGFGISLLILDAKSNVAILGREIDLNMDLTAIFDSGLLVGYGTKFLDDRVSVGFTGKALYRVGGHKAYGLLDSASGINLTLDPDELGGAGLGFDLDWGVMYLPSARFALALSVNNLVSSTFTSFRLHSDPPKLPRTLSLGATYRRPSFWGSPLFTVDLAEFQVGEGPPTDLGGREGSVTKHINLGAEWSYGKSRFRLGLHQGYPTLGFGLRFRHFVLDAAYYTEELSQGIGRLQSTRFGLRLAFGLSPTRRFTSLLNEKLFESKEKLRMSQKCLDPHEPCEHQKTTGLENSSGGPIP